MKAYNAEASQQISPEERSTIHEIVETPQHDPPGPPVPENTPPPDLPESDLDIPDDHILDFVNSHCKALRIWTRLFNRALRIPP